MKWISINEEMPRAEDSRVLTFSECYDEENPMRFRMMNAQFVHICTDVTYWMRLEAPLTGDSGNG